MCPLSCLVRLAAFSGIIPVILLVRLASNTLWLTDQCESHMHTFTCNLHNEQTENTKSKDNAFEWGTTVVFERGIVCGGHYI